MLTFILLQIINYALATNETQDLMHDPSMEPQASYIPQPIKLFLGYILNYPIVGVLLVLTFLMLLWVCFRICRRPPELVVILKPDSEKKPLMY